MTDTVYRSLDDTPVDRGNVIEAPTESAAEWREAADDLAGKVKDDSPMTVTEAVRERARTRKPLVVRKDKSDKPSTLREAGADLAFTRKLEKGKTLLERGLTPQQALEAMQPPPVVEEPVEDDGGKLSVRKAAKLHANYREEVAAQRAEALAALMGEPEQTTEGEPEQTTESRQPEHQPASAENANYEPPQDDPLHAERAQIQAERQRIAAERELSRASQAEVRLVQETKQISDWAAQNYPDIRGPQDLARLQKTNPARFQQFVAADQAFRQRQMQFMQVHQARQMHEAVGKYQGMLAEKQQFGQWAASQNQLIEAETEELKHPDRAPAFRRAVGETLKAVGVSRESLQDPAVKRALVSLEGQRLLRDATRWRMAQTRAREVTRAPLPPVLRPGTARPAGASYGDQARSLDEQIGRAGSLKDQLRLAAKAVAMGRRARRG